MTSVSSECMPKETLEDFFDNEESEDGLGDNSQPYEALAALQRELEEARDARKEERFVWFVTLIVVFDAFLFKEMQTWAGPIAIGFMQVLLIVAVGRKWSMDHIYTITEMIINKWNGKFKSD